MLKKEDFPPWRWARFVPEYLGPKIPPDFVLDPKFTEAKAAIAESKATAEEPKQQTFYYAAIKTRYCVDDDLAFSEGLAKVYARILEDKGEKVFLKGNIFLSKLAKAVFEQNSNLFAEACGKYADEEYFKKCAEPVKKWGFVVEEGEKFDEESWLSLYKMVLLLTEEYLATKCELPKISVFECGDNSEGSNNLEIIVAKQNTGEAELDEAALFPLGGRDFDDSSDELKAGELFYEFLGKNFPFKNDKKKLESFMKEIYGEDVCKDLEWFCKDIANNSLPRSEIKIEIVEEENASGSCKSGTICIDQRLLLDSFSSAKPEPSLVLFLTMLAEYGLFLGGILHEKASLEDNSSDGVARDFVSGFMEHSPAGLFSKDFEFADFIAPDAKGEEQKFVAKVSSLSSEQRKGIFYMLGIEST